MNFYGEGWGRNWEGWGKMGEDGREQGEVRGGGGAVILCAWAAC